MKGSDDVIGELLALPPEEFTAARNAAVKRLRSEGQRDAAETIKALPRPPLSLWALNRLAREQPELIEAFLRAADELREAYRSGGDIRAATTPEREAEAGVVAAAAKLARSGGKKPTETVLERLRQTVRAIAADAEVAAELRESRLIHEPEAPSIGDLLGSMPATAPDAKAKASPKHDREDERRALRDQIAAAKAEQSQAHSELRDAADAARAAEREWKQARKAAELAQKTSDAAEQELEDLQQRLSET